MILLFCIIAIAVLCMSLYALISMLLSFRFVKLDMELEKFSIKEMFH